MPKKPSDGSLDLADRLETLGYAYIHLPTSTAVERARSSIECFCTDEDFEFKGESERAPYYFLELSSEKVEFTKSCLDASDFEDGEDDLFSEDAMTFLFNECPDLVLKAAGRLKEEDDEDDEDTFISETKGTTPIADHSGDNGPRPNLLGL